MLFLGIDFCTLKAKILRLILFFSSKCSAKHSAKALVYAIMIIYQSLNQLTREPVYSSFLHPRAPFMFELCVTQFKY